MAAKENHSYNQIVKSSALMGGTSLLNIAVGIIRTKAMAALLGPAGFGLASLYGSITDLTQNFAGMGINSSGVRQIAEAAGSGEIPRIARTAVVLRRTSILLGVVGGLLLLLFSRQVSTFTFGNDRHTAAVSLLSLAVLFRIMSAGQGSLIQGLRRISDLAKLSVFSAIFGTIFGIPLVYLLGEKGVAPSLVIAAAMTLITSWWFSRKVTITTPAMTASQVRQEASALLKLGFAFMASGFMVMGVAYAVRLIVLRSLGFEATGLYQAAWTLGGLYVGFVLQAMGADFYPRLTACINDHVACNRLVNEQTRVGLLLAGPGVIATLTFAPIVIALLYSSKFAAAVDILRWITLGATLQVVTWPMGFIIVAKGKQGIFFGAELAWTVVAVALAWICIRSFGVKGAGIAFFGSYIFHAMLIYPIARRLSGFRWSRENHRLSLLFFSLIATVFCGFYALPSTLALAMGALALIIGTAYSIRTLSGLLSWEQIPRPLRRLLGAFRLVSAER
jgi:PST family polysaccharide transporter